MKTTEAWGGKFGDAYLERNQVDWRVRIPFWHHIVTTTGVRSAFELGCNAGWNLSALWKAEEMMNVWGCDINEKALDIAWGAGLNVFNANDKQAREFFPNNAELTFTAGVLIHIAPRELKEVMQRLIDMSSRYVLAVEYDSDVETEIEYRGQMGLLWKRPYGELYERMGLTLVETGKLQADVGFDNCRYWLMQK
jgi:pseudaminic acid biosynthesis-associated methylase